MPLNESELKKLEQIADEAAREHVDSCSDCRDISKKFRNLFTPRTCAELVREVLRLKIENGRLEKERNALLTAMCGEDGCD